MKKERKQKQSYLLRFQKETVDFQGPMCDDNLACSDFHSSFL